MFSYNLNDVRGIRDTLNLKNLSFSTELTGGRKKPKSPPDFVLDKPKLIMCPMLFENPKIEEFLSEFGLFPLKIMEFK